MGRYTALDWIRDSQDAVLRMSTVLLRRQRPFQAFVHSPLSKLNPRWTPSFHLPCFRIPTLNDGSTIVISLGYVSAALRRAS